VGRRRSCSILVICLGEWHAFNAAVTWQVKHWSGRDGDTPLRATIRKEMAMDEGAHVCDRGGQHASVWVGLVMWASVLAVWRV